MRLLAGHALLATACLASTFEGRENQNLRRAVKYFPNKERADAVKEAFEHAWDGYYRYAFPNDELRPVSNSYANGRNGWGASAVDALSTAIIMELDEIVDVILEHVQTIDWGITSDAVSVFETTIRYLGGMLSGYDLLSGPFSHLGFDPNLLNGLLHQAKSLADHLAPAFNTTTGIPDNIIDIATGALKTADQSTGLAVAGTLVIEWTRLSDLLGDPFYADLAHRAEKYLLKPSYLPPHQEPFPGLEGTTINYTTGQFVDMYGGWGGGTDSFYEYLIKMWVYDSVRFYEYKDRWIAAADSTIQYLLQHPSSRPDLTFVSGYNGRSLMPSAGHLDAFIGGNFLLGGLVLDRQEFIAAGLQFTAAWRETYTQTATRIGPESFGWLPESCSTSEARAPVQRRDGDLSKRLQSGSSRDLGIDKPVSELATASTALASIPTRPTKIHSTSPTCILSSSVAAQADFYAHAGFYINRDSYDLRPEVFESYYYAYRITGDARYQEWAWDAFVAINSTARVGSGFSDFTGTNGMPIQYGDFQESFLFAELLKYAYLIFAEDGPWQVNFGGSGANEFVFNTEAHPLRTRKPSRTSST